MNISGNVLKAVLVGLAILIYLFARRGKKLDQIRSELEVVHYGNTLKKLMEEKNADSNKTASARINYRNAVNSYQRKYGKIKPKGSPSSGQ